MDNQPNLLSDFHVHSTYSDGTVSPTDLVEMAADIGLHALAISDHDTTSAFMTAWQEAHKHKLLVLPAIELSCELDGKNVHVLGYGFNPNSEILYEYCMLHCERRKKRVRDMLTLLKKYNILIQEEEVYQKYPYTRAIGRPHIAQIIVDKGYMTTIKEVFVKLIGNDKPCYVAGEKWQVTEAIEALHQASGFAVIAHPHLVQEQPLLNKLINLPFDGIETFYSHCSPRLNKRWQKVAERKKLFMTGGSDFHGLVKPEVKLGSSLTPTSTAIRLFNHFWSKFPEFYQNYHHEYFIV